MDLIAISTLPRPTLPIVYGVNLRPPLTMSHAILTIIVPTYNRATHLAVLLTALRSELQRLESFVEVLVSDNASTDSTPEVTADASRDWPALTIQRHDRNLGPEGNFLSCVPRVSTRYFWIMGDDDCPKRGVLAKVVKLLRERKPALLYMQSEWVNPLHGLDQGEAVGDLRVSEMSALQFAETLHVWVTFISGMVIDRERLLNFLGDHSINRFNATSLVQLGWVLPLLRSKGPFLFIENRCVLATSGNTGGYQVLKTFCVNFPRVLREFFQDKNKVTDVILKKHMERYLPGLIWGARFNNLGDFLPEKSQKEINEALGIYLQYWLLLWPIINFSKPFALPFYLLARAISRFQSRKALC